ncbi:exocyst complex component Sec6-domain-containing protein [Gorgonomyces haynaldii]|nr:exocyst complex component Sec6-domain-containing protein [Gorgonomyces haynaldii]
MDLTSTDFVSDAHETAILRIADILRHPDDLTNKLNMLRRKVAMERASVEAQLKTVMEVQLDSMQKGIDTIRLCKTETSQIQQALKIMDNICGDEQNNIPNYTHIRKVARAQMNFAATKSMVESFQKVNDQINRAQKLLDEDSKVLIGPAENILLIHHNIQKLSAFRSKTLQHARGSSSDVLNTLNQMFKRLEQIEYRFDNYLWDLAKNTVNLVKSNYPSAVVRLIKLIEYEERSDEYVSAEEADNSQQGEKFRRIKGYRIKYFDSLRESIQADMTRMYHEQGKELVPVLKALDSVIDTLIVVHDDLTPLFPKRYNIFHFYVLEYHRAIYELVNQMTQGDMDPPLILVLTKWVRDYYTNMSARLDVNEDLLEPKLLDGREDELMATYVQLVRTKLAEWLTNILNSESLEFLERKLPPEMDTNGQYLLTGSVIVFQMFNQQLDVVAPASKGQLLYEIVVECCNTLESFQNSWLKILDSEYTKFVNKSNDLTEGIVEYTMALANDCYRSTEFSESIIARLESMSDDHVRKRIIDRLQSSLDGFVKITKRAQQVLNDIVMLDVVPAFKVMHCDQWYEQDVMRLIVGTFEDYCEDFQKHMSEYMFNKITSELMERFLVSYLESFKNKNAKFKMPTAVERMKQDMDAAIIFFSKSKSAKRVQQSFEIVQKVIALIDSNPRMMYLDFYSLWKAYPDMPLEYVEKLLSKRDDLDKGQVKDVMETCKTRAKEEKVEDFQPSLFSRINMK